MADALNKVMNMMLPNLEGNQMANLLGIDNMRKARGRGLLDAGLTAMALAGPRPATDNVNTAMILKQMVDQGTKTYDSAIDKQLKNYQTNLALQKQIDKKNSFSKLMDSNLFSTDEKEYAQMLGAVDGADFLTNVYMEKIKKIDKVPSVKEMVVMDKDSDYTKPLLNTNGDPLKQWVSVKEILDNPDAYQIPDDTGTFAKNIRDFENILKRELTLEEKQDYVLAKMNGQNITFTTGADGSTTLQIGGSASGSMEKGTKKNVEQQIINNSVNFEGFKEIQELYRPEFSTIPTRWKVWYKKIQDGLGDWNIFGDISEEDKKLISDYSSWEQKSWEMTNAYIKSITGAQMSEKEAERILKGFADPRKFSPTEYEAKLNGILENAMKSTIRYNLILRSGLTIPTDANGNLNPEAIMSLANVDKFVNDIGNEIKTELKADENWEFKSEEEIDAEVKRQLKLLMYGDPDNNVFTLENIR
tara:strand:+ start:17114 stop:18532 length:1419 start_codon:yes stop_codon:yes gene_type:complete